MATPSMKPGAKKAGGLNFEETTTPVRVLLGILIVAVIGLGYYLGIHSGIESDISAAEVQYAQLQNQYSEGQQRQQEFLRVTGELAAREGLDQRNKRILPEETEIAAFLGDLNRVAEIAGLEIRTVVPLDESPEELYVRIPVQLQVRGRFHEIMKFLYSVSRLERAINVENISLSDPEVENEEVYLRVSALGTTFRRPSTETP